MAPKTQQRKSRTAAARQPAGNSAAPDRNVGTFSSAWRDSYEPRTNPLAGISFTLDGEKFRCLGVLDLLDKSELSMLAMSSMDVRSPQGVGLVAQFLQLAFGPQEYMRFRAHTRAMDTPDEVTMEILAAISSLVTEDIEDETGRPTVPRSPSSAGQSATDERASRVISLQGGDVQIVPPDDPRVATG